MENKHRQMARLALMCTLAASLFTGSAIAEAQTSIADVLKAQSSIMMTAAKSGKTQAKKDVKDGKEQSAKKQGKSSKKQSTKKQGKSSKQQSTKKQGKSSKQQAAVKQDKNNKQQAAVKQGKNNKQQAAVKQGKNNKQQAAVKQNPASAVQNSKNPLAQQQDTLTRMLESKTLDKKTFDRIHAYLSAQKTTAAKQNPAAVQQNPEQENAALVRISNLVKEGKLKETLYQALAGVAAQARKANTETADARLTQSALQAMVQEKIITQNEFDAITAQLTQDLLDAAVSAKAISQPQADAAKPLLQQQNAQTAPVSGKLGKSK